MTMLLLSLTLGCGGDSEVHEPPPPTTTRPTADTGDTDATADTAHSMVSTVPTADTATVPPGCGLAPPASGSFSFDHDGVARTYALQVPEGYDPDVPAPLILAFHGWGGDEREYLRSAVVTDESAARGYLLVVPRGLGSGAPDQALNAWSFRGSTSGLGGDGAPICDDARTGDYTYASCEGVAVNGCSWTHCQDDDVDFIVDLLDALGEQLCIDPGRVFATGGSNGGMFTWELAQNERSAGRFRAVAPLIGLPHRGWLDAKGRPDDLPVLLVTGTEDRTVPPGGWDDPSFTTTSDGDRYYYTGATAITQVFAEAHGCDVSGAATPYDVGNPLIDCRTYCADDPGWPRAVDCRMPMGHTYQFAWAWPLILDFYDAWSP